MQEELRKYNAEQQDLIVKLGLQFYFCLNQQSTQNTPVVLVQQSPLNVQSNISKDIHQQTNKEGTIVASCQGGKQEIQPSSEHKYLDLFIQRQKEETKQNLNQLYQQFNSLLSSQVHQGQTDLQLVRELSDAKNFLNKIYTNQLENQQKIDNIYGNSAKKGQQAEQLVEQQIQQQYPQAIISNTSKLTNSGDLIVCLNNKRILVEVKNYGSSVPQKEVDKFINDVSTSQCESGIFISFNQRIVNKPRISFETSEQNKQLVYIAQQENSDLLLLIIEMLLQYNQSNIQTFESMQRQQKIASDTVGETIKLIKKQKLNAEKQVKDLQTLLNSLIQLESCLIQTVTSKPIKKT